MGGAYPLGAAAAAKVNLTLAVHGRLSDGYHAIESLILFAGLSDFLLIRPASRNRLRARGAFAEKLPRLSDNLIFRAAAFFDATLDVHLEKHIPVAAGLGGGSADAAAILRALSAMKSRRPPAPRQDAPPLSLEHAASLGSDIPASLLSKPLLAWGRGEKIKPLSDIPPLFAVLVKPDGSLSTARVYQSFGAEACRQAPPPSPPPRFSNVSDLTAWIAKRPNFLQETARSLFPELSAVLTAIRETRPLIARMSGSGPVCFGLYAEAGLAAAAAAAIAKRHRRWWLCATRLGGSERGAGGAGGAGF